MAGAAQAATGVGGDGAAPKPWFCHGLDCPRFDVVKRYQDYEVRRYDPGMWVSTTITDYGYSKAVKTGFWRLFKYIGGANERQQKLAMTAPVRVRVHPAAGPFCQSNFTVSFYVPDAFQDDVPTPSSGEVYVERAPAVTAYVASYGGWQSEDKFTAHAGALYEELGKRGVAVRHDEYYTAGYDSPFRLTHRHNEVWLLAKEDLGALDEWSAGKQAEGLLGKHS